MKLQVLCEPSGLLRTDRNHQESVCRGCSIASLKAQVSRIRALSSEEGGDSGIDTDQEKDENVA